MYRSIDICNFAFFYWCLEAERTTGRLGRKRKKLTALDVSDEEEEEDLCDDPEDDEFRPTDEESPDEEMQEEQASSRSRAHKRVADLDEDDADADWDEEEVLEYVLCALKLTLEYF